VGIYTLTLNIWDMKRCIDYLEANTIVGAHWHDGISQGGTMTAFYEPLTRIKAAISSVTSTRGGFGIARLLRRSEWRES
jgi:hypothetical protein